jgi:hypothetical protein
MHEGIFSGGNHMLIKIAAYGFSVIALLAVAFHFALALGILGLLGLALLGKAMLSSKQRI